VGDGAGIGWMNNSFIKAPKYNAVWEAVVFNHCYFYMKHMDLGIYALDD
jgi:hypothetical protein